MAPVDHNKLVPEVIKTEFPQLFVTVTIGVDGIAIGAAVPEPAKLAQPPTVCVTVYVPAEETVIEGVVAPVDHNKLVPEVVNTEFPQLFDTVTIGVEGTVHGGIAQIFNAQLDNEPPSWSAPSVIVNVQTPAGF